jgi:hypothetical protein
MLGQHSPPGGRVSSGPWVPRSRGGGDLLRRASPPSAAWFRAADCVGGGTGRTSGVPVFRRRGGVGRGCCRPPMASRMRRPWPARRMACGGRWRGGWSGRRSCAPRARRAALRRPSGCYTRSPARSVSGVGWRAGRPGGWGAARLAVAIDPTPILGRGAVKNPYHRVSDPIRRGVQAACAHAGGTRPRWWRNTVWDARWAPATRGRWPWTGQDAAAQRALLPPGGGGCPGGVGALADRAMGTAGERHRCRAERGAGVAGGSCWRRTSRPLWEDGAPRRRRGRSAASEGVPHGSLKLRHPCGPGPLRARLARRASGGRASGRSPRRPGACNGCGKR